MIEVESLTKRYGRATAVDGVSFRVEKGEILGFLGPNGAGKTTTVNMLTGMMQPGSGIAEVAGFDVVREPLEVKKRIGYIPESGAMYETLTPGEYLDFVSSLYHLDTASSRRRADDFLELFGIADARDKRMSELSKGMKQKVLITSALLHNPEVLFLDEPLNGLDANAAAVVKELLRKFAAQGKTIFFCSHILEVVERVCTRIVIISGGRQIAEGTAADITAASGSATLEEAFSRLTGVRDAGDMTAEFLAALEKDG